VAPVKSFGRVDDCELVHGPLGSGGRHDDPQFEVTIECDTWTMTAPWGRRTADVIEQPSLEAARRLSLALACEHGPQCVIAVRETDAARSPQLVAELRGKRDDCEHTERRFIAGMLARGQNGAEIGNRIEWARGHALIGDEAADALHDVLNRQAENGACRHRPSR
jgi:hypothetical protein